jgi:hypothetical protein
MRLCDVFTFTVTMEISSSAFGGTITITSAVDVHALEIPNPSK